jgi:phosphate acetyltransferase
MITFQDSEVGAITVPPAPQIIVHPCDDTSLRGALDSAELGIIIRILV